MPKAVVHVLFAIIILDLLRDYVIKDRKKMPLHLIFIGGVAGLLPDVDIPLYWLLKNILGIQVEWFHRTFSHSVFFPLILLIITLGLFALNKKSKVKKSKVWIMLAVITFGVGFHIFLDWLLSYNVALLYPLSNISYGLNLAGKIGWESLIDGLDAAVLLAWLWDLDRRHRLRDFI